MCELKNRYKDGYTGKLFEIEVFGECLNPADKKRASFKDAIKFVKENQPWNDPYSSSNPEPEVVNNLHAHIVRKLVGLDGDWSELKFFTSVNSPLDYLGIDGFFEYKGRRVTIDLTMNEESKEGKDDADLILSDDTIENEILFELFAGQVAEALQIV